MSSYPYRPVDRRTNGVAIATLVTGLLGMALIPIVLGHIALRQMKRTGEEGQALAVIGLVLGYLALAGCVLLIILMVAGIAFGVSAGQ